VTPGDQHGQVCTSRAEELACVPDARQHAGNRAGWQRTAPRCAGYRVTHIESAFIRCKGPPMFVVVGSALDSWVHLSYQHCPCAACTANRPSTWRCAASQGRCPKQKVLSFERPMLVSQSHCRCGSATTGRGPLRYACTAIRWQCCPCTPAVYQKACSRGFALETRLSTSVKANRIAHIV
jgi:hypothetical protein